MTQENRNRMKRTVNTAAAMLICLASAVCLTAATQHKGAISKKNGTTVVNTTSIAAKVRGYGGTTPLKIHISKNKITRIETLPNNESPGIFSKAKRLLSAYIGKDPETAAKMKVDAVSGATYSSEALIGNMRKGLEYYNSRK